MADQTQLSGTCMCGACTFAATPTEESAGACHCGMCRKWSGGMFMSVACRDVTFAADAPLGSYKGSAWGERVFCKNCGSSIMWQTQDGQGQHVSIQCFEDPARFPVNMQIFIDRKPANYALAGETKTMTEAEVFAMFAPDGDG